MIRFVVGPEHRLVPDVAGKLPGRGLWVRADRAALDRAVAKKLFAKAARAPVTVPPALPELVVALLRRRCLDWLGLARGSGQAVVGFDKLRERFAKRPPAVLLAAYDGAADGRGKLHRLWPDVPLVEIFGNEELSLSLGRENVVHAALEPGNLAGRFLTDIDRLTGLGSPEPQESSPNAAGIPGGAA